MAEERPRIVVIGGPTASGKTAVAQRLAQSFDGEIVSADSIQIYRYMDIGSAKPTAEERSRVPYHMVDIRNPNEDFSAGDFVIEARQCIEKILSRGRVPFVVGGTGLYIRLLLGGVVDAPSRDPQLRARLRAEEEQGGKGTLFARLVQVDPEAAGSIPPGNLRRIIRSLEIFELTRLKLSDLHSEHSFKDRPYRHLFVCLTCDRKVLYELIDKRVDSMIKGGLLEEVHTLLERGYSRELKPMQSLGYRHAAMILAGEMDADDAVELMKKDTRHYAKRQLTWFRSEPEVVWCDPDREERINLLVANFLGRSS